jgi:ABC-type Fe3+/spermidine/putrescine transport system ATPase subunit
MSGDLQIVGVSKTFGKVAALRDVSLEVKGGEFISLLGPSGCGKTTLLRIIAGFESPDAGDVILDGERLTSVAPFHRPVGLLFQSLALFPHLTVAGNVGFGLSVRREYGEPARQKIAASLALVELDGYEQRRIHQLSGGQKQRVALARALITEPKLLLLDEPLSALDLKLRRQLQAELRRLQRRTGRTFIFVTHDQEEAMVMSDRIAVFHQGRIAQVGAPQSIYQNPVNRFVAEFVGETNILQARRDGTELRLEDLGIVRPAPPEFPAGPSITLSLRPESIELLPGDHASGLAATVAELEYSGMMVRLSAAVPGRKSALRVALQAERARGLEIGAPVRLRIDPAAAVVLPEA